MVGVGLVVALLFAEELAAEAFGVVGAAVFEAEDVVVVLVSGAELVFLLVLFLLPFCEEGDCAGVEVDRVASSGLVAGFVDDLVVSVDG